MPQRHAALARTFDALFGRGAGLARRTHRFERGSGGAVGLRETCFRAGALVVEDLSADGFDERPLFHLLNLTREHDAFMLLTARTPPAGWKLQIADLASRLRALPVVALAPPDDALLRAVLVKLFADRQVAVDESLVAYLVTRLERSVVAARRMVDLLDREGLRLQRPVTRALAAEVLRGPGAL